jgi:hypothetical protein
VSLPRDVASESLGAGFAPLPGSPVEARKEFRRRYISRFYSGPLHFVFVNLLAVSMIAFCLTRVKHWGWLEIALVPITFLYANFVEFFVHKGPMHRLTKGFALIFTRHTLHHHFVLTDDTFEIETPQDMKMVLFPPYLLIFLIVFFGLPIHFLARGISDNGAAQVIAATAILYFLNYEWFHLIYHLPAHWPLGRLKWIKGLREHHRVHHDKALMSRYNFNITFPIADRVFGRTYKCPKNDSAKTAPLTHRTVAGS